MVRVTTRHGAHVMTTMTGGGTVKRDGRAYTRQRNLSWLWLALFLRRFFDSQWKRSVMPDGPKVGSVSLSPRGDWRMPSDAQASAWLRELEEKE